MPLCAWNNEKWDQSGNGTPYGAGRYAGGVRTLGTCANGSHLKKDPGTSPLLGNGEVKTGKQTTPYWAGRRLKQCRLLASTTGENEEAVGLIELTEMNTPI